MKWTTQNDLRIQVQRLWDSGQILSSLVNGNTLFPRRLQIRKPKSSDLSNSFEEVRTWVAELRQETHYRVVMRQLRHKVIGNNAVPDEIWIDTIDNALALIGKSRDAQKFSDLVALVSERQPELLIWLSKRPLKALGLSKDWPLILDIINWMRDHPQPGIYLRQVDIPGIHTKFIEEHRSILIELLDIVLPPDAINAKFTGIDNFCSRYGFLDQPLRVRLRILDPGLDLLAGAADQDLEITQDTFNRLEIQARQVFITENKVNFLSFPKIPGSIVIFGGGYGFEMLTDAAWLHQCNIHYWGDLDTHGFAILDQLRSHFPHVESFLMDRKTLMAHMQLWSKSTNLCNRELARLNIEERDLYDDLRNDRIGPAISLEQERIGFGWLHDALSLFKAS